MGDAHDAEDAVQDALLSAYKHLDQFKGTAKITTWLTSIVTNCALTQLRKRPRHPHVSLHEPLNEEQDYFLSDTLADVRPSPEDQCASSESHGLLMQFVSELSPSMQEAIQIALHGHAEHRRSRTNFAGSNSNNEVPLVAGACAIEADDARAH